MFHLPHDTHSALSAPLCNTPPAKDCARRNSRRLERQSAADAHAAQRPAILQRTWLSIYSISLATMVNVCMYLYKRS